ncbi:MAG: HK97 gp10 family phage protein [Acetatifactor sp.]|nr:HK97 gp10 family phage protein [Acetatifactor sp.]
MARMGGFDLSGLKELQKNLNKLQEKQVEKFIVACTKELASRLQAEVINRTPVGEYPEESGKQGGTLRRGWTLQNLKVDHCDGKYVIEIVNPVEYASYVEYGHRTISHKGWVPGQFMMTISEREINQITPALLEDRIKRFLGGVFQ